MNPILFCIGLIAVAGEFIGAGCLAAFILYVFWQFFKNLFKQEF